MDGVPTAARRALIDLPTAGVILIMASGFVLVVSLCDRGVLPLWVGAIAGTFLMNLSFTSWHEAAHGNFSRSAAVNRYVGVFASIASVYPGYFVRRREHLLHHRYEGDPARDPVYPRIQAALWVFPWRLLRTNRTWRPSEDTRGFLPLTAGQRAVDALSLSLVLALIGASYFSGSWRSVAAVWLMPRLAIFLVHAYAICFLPHAIPGGGYEVFRVRDRGLLVCWVTLGQNYHGLHHRWPAIPWHRYRAIVRSRRADLQAAGIRFV